jgi:hypothetical protein
MIAIPIILIVAWVAIAAFLIVKALRVKGK